MSDYDSIVILTGAGISAESGIDTFRGKDGIWSKIDIEDVGTPDAFRRNPEMVHDFHNQFRRSLQTHEPNDAHRALARLERGHPGSVLVVTQNVDDLHERAGSENLIHMHGELYKARCEACGGIRHWTDDLGLETACGDCEAAGRMRPHVTWFYEMPMGMEEIQSALGRCDLFISIGTSGNVYPAAGFVADVRRGGRAHTVELNLEPSEGTSLFAEYVHGPATEVVPAYVDELLG
ncbi:MAG: NAD-dependent deacylase [Alphaproteobacteria bacterium]|jgi:NAD-dependent deacetylase|nr:NAD-dependent deacylase [Alphaproteobacteria bacterium]MDP6567522.1 NAD-dependent deacylase [Alphaproteobacteria bacterium]MDP6813173.1 NAD-dependent deacylase [Alphaproteobacteria bacterium]